jgi:hypothetical protein
MFRKKVLVLGDSHLIDVQTEGSNVVGFRLF